MLTLGSHLLVSGAGCTFLKTHDEQSGLQSRGHSGVGRLQAAWHVESHTAQGQAHSAQDKDFTLLFQFVTLDFHSRI